MGHAPATLQQLEDSGTLWSTYGADATDYADALAALQGLGLPPSAFIGDATGSDGYISSPESRTIWLSLDPAQFATVFGTTPYQDVSTTRPGLGELYYWNGSLSVPEAARARPDAQGRELVISFRS